MSGGSGFEKRLRRIGAQDAAHSRLGGEFHIPHRSFEECVDESAQLTDRTQDLNKQAQGQ